MSRDALIVGINSYQYLPHLKAPANDAEAIARYLEQDGEFRIWRVPEQIDQAHGNRPIVSSTQQVSQVQLKQALKQLFLPDSQQAPETALFYFSGHGIRDQEGFDKGYLAISDTNPKNPISGISLRWLQWLLSESQVKQQIIWLDCCHSGALIVNVGAANPGNSESRDRCFIASSRDFETSWEDLNSPYSVLTKALLEGLEPSRLPGRWIDNFALVDYVNQALKGELQMPVCINFGEAINLTRSYYKQEAAVIYIDGDALCPYKGLSYFEDNDHDYQYFYGRRALIDELVDSVRTSDFVAIVGASGSGKSSVLRAGLLHQLRQGRISGSDLWDIRLMLPGQTPCQALSVAFVDVDAHHLERTIQLGKAEALINEGADGLRRLVQTADADRTMLIIDQFEEVFTLCQDDAERQRFFKTVIGALKTANNKLCVVLTMRADFVGRCFEKNYSGLSELIRNHLIPLKPMATDELRQAIEAPAKRVNLKLEPELVQILIKDVENSPGSLPLLQYTLKTLWETRKDNTLELKAYTQLGGVNETLKQQANKVYNNLDKEQQRTARHIFLNLTQLGEGTEDTRRRVSKDSLISAQHSADLIEQVVKRLADANLVVTNELIGKATNSRKAIVDVAHEALIRNWPKLRQWLEEDRDLLRQQRRIELAAEEWQTQKKAADYLLQGRIFLDARRFQKEHGQNMPLSQLGETFVQQSLRHRRNNRLKLWGLSVLTPLGIAIYSGLQIQTYFRLRPHWESLNSYNAHDNKVSSNSLVRALREINTANRSLANIALSSADLNNADLNNADLNNANLNNANLNNANLNNANLSHAKLRNADLSDANLRNADLRNADLSDANLRNADLRNAKLSRAKLFSAGINNAYLSSAHLRNADLRNADLSDAILRNADLNSVDLRNAKLFSANLTLTDLSFAKLRSADLSNAILNSTDLSNAILNSTDLSNAKLRSANISNAILNSTDLSNAHLNYTDFSNAKLNNARLNNAILINTNLSNVIFRDVDFNSVDLRQAMFSNAILINANLSDVNLSYAIFLATDLRTTQGLTRNQLEGDNQPLLCNSPLHLDIDIEGDKDRDCDQLADILYGKYPDWFKTIEESQEYVHEQQQRTWE